MVSAQELEELQKIQDSEHTFANNEKTRKLMCARTTSPRFVALFKAFLFYFSCYIDFCVKSRNGKHGV